jgi:hypothetical protein
MTEKEIEILKRKLLSGMSYEAAAASVGVSEHTARRLLQRVAPDEAKKRQQDWRDKRRKRAKWGELLSAAAVSKIVSVPLPRGRIDLPVIRGMLNASQATNRFRWSVTSADGKVAVAKRIDD